MKSYIEFIKWKCHVVNIKIIHKLIHNFNGKQIQMPEGFLQIWTSDSTIYWKGRGTRLSKFWISMIKFQFQFYLLIILVNEELFHDLIMLIITQMYTCLKFMELYIHRKSYCMIDTEIKYNIKYLRNSQQKMHITLQLTINHY